jgi:hypothetical protein
VSARCATAAVVVRQANKRVVNVRMAPIMGAVVMGRQVIVIFSPNEAS